MDECVEAEGIRRAVNIMSNLDIQIKRAYEVPCREDGYRILVDRVWPRGLSRAKIAIDEWNKVLPPTTGLRKWFGHKSQNWEPFKFNYLEELNDPAKISDIERIRKIAALRQVTLVYGAQSTTENHAIILRDYMLI